MRYFITGSSGFIGGSLVQTLRALGHSVAGYDKTPPLTASQPEEFTLGDILDASLLAESLRSFAPDIVVHLAAKTSLKEVSPGSDHYAANTIGTRNLLDAIESCSSIRRSIFASTKYVCRGRTPEDERDFQPHTSYGRSKAEMEEIIRDRNGGGRDWCIVRPTTVWGPGMGPHYQNFLSLIQRGRYFHIGGAKTRKHLSYVGNFVHQMVRLAEAPSELIHGRVFYFADYDPLTLCEWTETLRKALAAPPIFSIPFSFALPLAKAGDMLVKIGIKNFPFTSFRFKNLTEDDICLVEPTRNVCGDLPYSLASAAEETAAWFHSLPKQKRR